MKILITGGLGYIGGRIFQFIREKEPECQLFLTTRNLRKRPEWTNNADIIEMDVLKEKSIKNCLSIAQVDVIIHLASLNEIESAQDPKLAIDVNTKGTFKLLNIANEEGIKNIVYFSTFHVYGLVTDSVITEDTATKPYHPYAITHRSAEDYVRYFKHYFNFETLTLRLSNGYGYPMHRDINRWTLLFNDLCKQAVIEGKIVLRSSGKQYRDFISLNDVARAVYHFIFLEKDKWGDGLFNLGGDCNMSVMEVAEKISEIYKKKYKKSKLEIIIDSKDTDLTNTKPIKYSIDKLSKTGFQLENTMDYEINKTMELCEQFMK